MLLAVQRPRLPLCSQRPPPSTQAAPDAMRRCPTTTMTSSHLRRSHRKVDDVDAEDLSFTSNDGPLGPLQYLVGSPADSSGQVWTSRNSCHESAQSPFSYSNSTSPRLLQALLAVRSHTLLSHQALDAYETTIDSPAWLSIPPHGLQPYCWQYGAVSQLRRSPISSRYGCERTACKQ